MKEPFWITREVVLSTHEALLHRFGGLAGIRDEGLLESALNRPRQLFHYGEPDFPALATAYAAGIVKNHPFLDGNKRTGFMVAYIFLEANGLRFEATEEAVCTHTLALAAGMASEDDYRLWLESSCRPASE